MKKNRDPNRPKVPELASAIDAIYDREDGSGCTGCCLHVLADDDNYDAADFCLGEARKEGHADCIKAAELAAQMTYSQIKRAVNWHWDRPKQPPASDEPPIGRT